MRRGDPHPRGGHRRAARWLVYRPLLDPHAATRPWSAASLYLPDSYADDLPYWLAGPGGTGLVVPYTLDANDMRFATPQGFNSGDQFFAYLRDTFDVLYAEGETAPKMMSVGLHCRLVGRPGRMAALARFLDHVAAHDRVWLAAPHRHRPALDRPPSGAVTARFVLRAGTGLFEETPMTTTTIDGRTLAAAEVVAVARPSEGRFASAALAPEARQAVCRDAGLCRSRLDERRCAADVRLQHRRRPVQGHPRHASPTWRTTRTS